MSDSIEKTNYKNRLLDHFIEAALDAIKRGRAAWLLGIIIVFIFGVAVFNATYSWNDSQVERRAQLYGTAVNGYDAVKELAETNKSIGNALNNGTGELGYLRPIWEVAKSRRKDSEEIKIPEMPPEITDENTKIKIQERIAKVQTQRQNLEVEVSKAVSDLKNAVFSDLNSHVARRISFDTVGIPFLGSFVTATDYGIVGGIALIIVGYWLLAMLRRQLLILNEFVKLTKRNQLEKGAANFSSDDLIYACNRIKHYMVFSIPEPKSWLSYITTASFLAAPLLLILNHYLSVKDLYWKNLGSYLDGHFMTEGLITIIGTFVWITGLFYQYNSMQLMKQWELECVEEHPFTPPET